MLPSPIGRGFRGEGFAVEEDSAYLTQFLRALDFVCQQGHAPLGEGELALDLGEVTGLHLGAGGKKRVSRAVGRDDAVDDQAEVFDVQFLQFSDGSASLLDGNRLGMQHKHETCLRGLAHGGEGALVLVLRVLDGRRGPQAGLPAARAGRVDGLAPLGG